MLHVNVAVAYLLRVDEGMINHREAAATGKGAGGAKTTTETPEGEHNVAKPLHPLVSKFGVLLNVMENQSS